jgi:hypothetical protein
MSADLPQHLSISIPAGFFCLQAFDVVAWLDVLSAKVRFGGVIGGVLPAPTPWPDVFRHRSGAALATAAAAADAAAAAAAAGAGGGVAPGGIGTAAAARRAADRATLRLNRLQHPLLLVEYLVARQQLERQLRAMPGGGAAGSGVGGARAPARRSAPQDRQQRRAAAAAAAAAAAGSSSSSGSDSDEPPSLQQQLDSLQPPVPVDLVVQPETSVVVITGTFVCTNTNSMTA